MCRQVCASGSAPIPGTAASRQAAAVGGPDLRTLASPPVVCVWVRTLRACGPGDARMASAVQWRRAPPMLPFTGPSTPLVLALPARARVADFADGCRAAALDFVNRVAREVDKEQLAVWLRGPYRAHVVVLARSLTRRMGAATVAPGALERLLTQARREVEAALEGTRDPEEGVSLGFSALSSGLVYRCQDAEGTPGWVPVAHPRMRLADRVLSLVAADYL